MDSQTSATGVVVDNEGPVVVSVEVSPSPSTARVGESVTCSAAVTPEHVDGAFVTYDRRNVRLVRSAR